MSEHHDPCTPSVCLASSPVRWMRRAVVWIVVGLAVIFSAVELGLPWLAQQVLVPRIAQELGTDEASIQVRALRLGGLDIGPIRLGPGLSVQAMQVDWSLTGLVRGRIAHVRLMGLEVQAMHEETGWSIAGLPKPVQTQSKETDSGQPFFLPHIDTFTVDGRLMAEHQGNAMALAFFTQGQMTDKGVAARLVVDSSYGSATVRLDAGQTDPYAFFCDWSLDMHTLVIPARSGLHLAGSSSVIRTATGWDMQTRARLAQVEIMLPGKQNFILAPSQIEISALTDEQTRIQADLFLGNLAAQTLAGTVEIHGLAATIHATASPENGSGAFTLSGSQARAIAVEKEAHLETLKVQGDFSWGSEQSVTATLELGALKIQMPEAEVSAQAVTAAIHATQSKDNGTGTVHLSKAQVAARVPGLDLATAALQAQGEMSWGTEMYANATLKTDAQVKSKDISATAQLTLPLAWPKPAPTPGQLDARVRWQNKDAAKLAVRLTQKQDFMAVDGQIHIQPVGIQATVQGQVHPFALRDSWAQFQAEHSLSLPGALADFVPQTRELSGSATVRAKGNVHMPQGVVQIPLQLEVRDAQIRHAQSGFTLDNGSASLDFDNILTMRSKPDQKLGFVRAGVGDIVLEQADIRYQVEAAHSIFVERATLGWAGGRVGTQSFRINPGIEDYAVELYCDRIELAQVLRQLGMGQAQGGGRANGRIPVRYAKGALTFTDGFLYSTPGEPGKLRVPGTDILTTGVPPDSPQFAQLDLAAEALKDFTYEWAKIGLQTQNKELRVALELDGKPTNPLPFVYNKDIGGFARVSASSPGSVFQGIRLDVNFRLPLDQLMQYRQLLELLKNGG